MLVTRRPPWLPVPSIPAVLGPPPLPPPPSALPTPMEGHGSLSLCAAMRPALCRVKSKVQSLR